MQEADMIEILNFQGVILFPPAPVSPHVDICVGTRDFYSHDLTLPHH